MIIEPSITEAPAQQREPWLGQFSQLVYGGDYNPEQWPEEIWREDAALMREAGVNLVSLGVFAWARCEPQPGIYDFAWLDTVLDLLHEYGVRVNLATGTPAPPPWLSTLHPESLPVTADGIVLGPGSRRHYSPHSSAYRQYAARFVTVLAERYARHPALAMWHVDNEYSCHVSECFGPEAAPAFRNWLRQRYETIDALNTAWGTTFWGQIYGEWDEIQPPRRTPYMHNPGMLLDWKRFSSAALLTCFEEQRAILKRITPDIPVTTNFMGFNKALDHWAWADQEDVVANDSYPEPSDPDSPLQFAMECDLMRSLGKGRPWLLMEQVTSHVNWRDRNTTRRPGQMRVASYQALGRGANGVMFFQWRASRSGGEQFHGAMLPHGGRNTRSFREVTQLGAELQLLAALRESHVQAEAAILLDYESWWALEHEGKPSRDVRLLDGIRAAYEPLYRANIAVDFAHPAADMSRYKLVIAPHLFMLGDGVAANLQRYVADGGTLLMSFFSAIVDAQQAIWQDGYLGPLREVLGLSIDEFAPYALGQANAVITDDEELFACQLWSDVLRLEGAEVIGYYRDDFFASTPALTRHRYGSGTSYYLGTALESSGMAWLLARLTTELGLVGSPAPEGCESIVRNDGTRSWRFVFNHQASTAQLKLAANEHELLSGQQGGVLQLPQFAVAIVEAPQAR